MQAIFPQQASFKDHPILVCAPWGQDAALIDQVLADAGIQSTVCPHVCDMLEQLKQETDALLVGEEAITGIALHDLAAAIASQPVYSSLPVLLLCRRGARSLELQHALAQLGHAMLVEQPVHALALVTAVQSALRFRQRQYQIRDAEQRKDEFFAALAHELRNPLAPIKNAMAILGHLNFPQDAADLPALQRIVERQVLHLTRLVDDLLDVARITKAKVVLKKSAVALPSVIRHAVELSIEALQAKNHQLVMRFARPPELLLDADPARLVQSLANVLANAAKFTPAGGCIMLHTSADPETGELSLVVQDNGIGMTSKSLSRIFEIFAQTLVPGEAPAGLGIGLSLAQRFTQMHGGTLHASSDGLGKGSTFFLRLPVVLPVNLPVESSLMKTHELQSPPMLNKHKNAKPFLDRPVQRKIVLVVDDNVDAANTLNTLLGLDGFTVTTVYDGAQAVAAVEAHVPDIVVMDIGMPHMDGYEAARQMRKRYSHGSLLLIALTGWGQTSDIDRAMAAGFDHHMVKPVDYEQLLQCFGGSSNSVQLLADSVASAP